MIHYGIEDGRIFPGRIDSRQIADVGPQSHSASALRGVWPAGWFGHNFVGMATVLEDGVRQRNPRQQARQQKDRH